jgi:hypothetical protein
MIRDFLKLSKIGRYQSNAGEDVSFQECYAA